MSIRRFFNQDIVVRRLSEVSGTKRKIYQATATVEGHIQGLDDEARQILGILEEKAWKAWFPVDADISEHDIITDEDGTEYEVREIVTKSYGCNQHKEIILQEHND